MSIDQNALTLESQQEGNILKVSKMLLYKTFSQNLFPKLNNMYKNKVNSTKLYIQKAIKQFRKETDGMFYKSTYCWATCLGHSLYSETLGAGVSAC